jgi:hypothetical protein
MSDDDLWRPKEPAAGAESGDPAAEDADDGAGQADRDAVVGDETQPITGGTPAPPSPSYGSPSGPGAVPPPHNPFSQQQGAQNPQDPYGGQPGPFGQQSGGYPGQPGPSQPYCGTYAPPPNPYPSPQEYGTPQNPYGAPYQPAYAGGVLPDHPSATTAMVLGIIGLVGIALCGGLTLILSPAAWVVGAKAVREIDASQGRYAGRDRAQAGKVMGIIGTVLLALGILAVIAIVVVAIAVGSSSDPTPAFPSPNV